MTTRAGGVSVAPCDSLNLGGHVGDDPEAVAANRARWPRSSAPRPVYLRQVHGNARAPARRQHAADGAPAQADAASPPSPASPARCWWPTACRCCSPRRTARAVGAAHAGWRGLAGGVVERTRRGAVRGRRVRAATSWRHGSGRASGRDAFEVGADVLEAFGARAGAGHEPARFDPGRARDGKCAGRDLAGSGARPALRRPACAQVSGGRWCTVEDRSRFFSFRRDGVTGRMAAGVWIDRPAARPLGAPPRRAPRRRAHHVEHDGQRQPAPYTSSVTSPRAAAMATLPRDGHHQHHEEPADGDESSFRYAKRA